PREEGGLRRGSAAARLRRRHLDMDEGPQAVVLAEVAARRLVAGRPIGDPAYGVEANEPRPLTALIEPPDFDCRADGAGLAAVLVHDDLGLDVRAAEVRADE